MSGGQVSAVRATPAAGASWGASAAAASPLLADPKTMSPEGMNDAMSMIYALISKQSQNDLKSGEAAIDTAKNARKAHEQEAQAARERQKMADGDGSRGFFGSIGHIASDIVHNVTTLHAQDLLTDAKDDLIEAGNSPNFWKDLESGAKTVGEVAAVVGATVGSVATFGAAAPALVVVCVIGLSLMAAGVAESKLHYLEAAGMSSEAAGYLGTGMMVGGTVLTMGAASGAAAGEAGEVVEGVAIGVEVEAGVVQGAAHIEVSTYEAASFDAGTDTKQAMQAIAKNQRLVEELLDAVKEVNESHRHALGTLQGAMATHSQTLVISSTRA